VGAFRRGLGLMDDEGTCIVAGRIISRKPPGELGVADIPLVTTGSGVPMDTG